MKLLMQGMRRSGTTIIYDALCQDERLTSWYEPLAAAKAPAMGGGSGVQKEDLFRNLRHLREEFCSKNSIDSSDVLNHGAPRIASLEFTDSLPDTVLDYLNFMFNVSDNFMAKFTRMYCKVGCLKALCPDGVFVHLVRDPKAVVSSYLFGKNQRNKKHFPDSNVYFERISNCSAWSSRPFSDCILDIYDYVDPHSITDLERILLIWKFTFEETRDHGLDAFGTNYLLVRHEDFCENPRAELERIYSKLGEEVPSNVLGWAQKYVRKPASPFEHNNQRWKQSFAKLHMQDSLTASGY